MPIVKITVSAADAAVNTIASLIDAGGGGDMQIRSGVMPLTPETVASGVVLALHPLSVTAFAPSTGGSASANPIAPDTATAAGTATWARIYNNAGTAIIDLDVGIGATFSVNVSNTVFAAGGSSTVNSLTLNHGVA